MGLTWRKMAGRGSSIQRERLMTWRREGSVVRLKKPSRPDRARRLGYSAKTGFVILRVKIGKGGSKRERPAGGRVPSKAGQTKYSSKISQRVIAEQRASKKHPNLEVLNSYYVGEDGQRKWFEVILVDKNHPQILSSKKTSWIGNVSGRVRRGLTSAGRSSRGLHKKGLGSEKTRPSIRANKRVGK